MGLRYENLDAVTRACMAEESALGGHYQSPRLTPQGLAAWVPLFDEAIAGHNDDWLAGEILRRGMLARQEAYVRNGKQFFRNINAESASQMLAEGEFNRYYLRGLCIRAVKDGVKHLEVYRGRESARPRPESEEKIGTLVPVEGLLDALRSNDFVSIEESAFGIPGGPNSGLTAKLP